MNNDPRVAELLEETNRNLRRLSGLASVADLTPEEKAEALERKIENTSLPDLVRELVGENVYDDDGLWQAHLSKCAAEREAEKNAVHDRTMVIGQ